MAPCVLWPLARELPVGGPRKAASQGATFPPTMVFNATIDGSHGAAQPQPHAVQDPTGSTPSETKALGPTLRANPCPEVTDPFCRLPLPTLSHWPEAFHLGDLMRL
jgi:hypothetical protein